MARKNGLYSEEEEAILLRCWASVVNHRRLQQPLRLLKTALRRSRPIWQPAGLLIAAVKPGDGGRHSRADPVNFL